MTTGARWRGYVSIETDYWAVLLALMFLIVIGGALALVPWATSIGAEPAMSGSSASEQAAAGGGWAIAEVLAAVVLLGVIALWNRLPEWCRDTFKETATVVIWMFIGAVAFGAGEFWTVMGGGMAVVTVLKTAEAFDVYWLVNNLLGLAVAIIGAAIFGILFPLPFLAVGLVGLTLYDHYFANQNDWMFTLGEGLLRARLPLVILAMPRLRADWDDICDSMAEADDAGDELMPEERGFGIGTADLLLPAALAVAVVNAVGTPIGGVVPVVGVVIGVMVAAFRLRWEMLNVGSGAGLPAITSGALGGWAIGAVVVMLV